MNANSKRVASVLYEWFIKRGPKGFVRQSAAKLGVCEQLIYQWCSGDRVLDEAERGLAKLRSIVHRQAVV